MQLGARTWSGVIDDMANQGKTLGQAVAHNGAGIAVGAAALALTPVGWGVVGAAAVGLVAGLAFDAAYSSNFLGIRDGLDWIGSNIDKELTKLFNPPRRSVIVV